MPTLERPDLNPFTLIQNCLYSDEYESSANEMTMPHQITIKSSI